MKVFLDIYLALNFGDDLFLDIILKRYPDVEFILNYTGEEYREFLKEYKNAKKRNYNIFHKILRRAKVYNHLENYDLIAKECDCAVFIGGSIFRDEPYHNSLYKERTRILDAFSKKRKDVYVLGSNFGPALNESFYKDYYNFFKRCKDVCFRDSYSKNLFLDLKNVRIASDIVFSIDKFLDEQKKIKKKKLIGYSIIDFNHKNNLEKNSVEYINKTVESIEHSIELGYECELLSFCEIEGDKKVIEQILSNVKNELKSKVRVYLYNGNIEEIISKIASYEIFVAARFHANILGFLLETKLIPVIYNKKTENLLDDLFFDGPIIKIDELKKLENIEILKQAKKFKLNKKTILESENQFMMLDRKLRGNL